jgi:hypothetical protein
MPEVSIWYPARAKGATVKATPAKAGDSLAGIVIVELSRRRHKWKADEG